jgi:hypothetical protein
MGRKWKTSCSTKSVQRHDASAVKKKNLSWTAARQENQCVHYSMFFYDYGQIFQPLKAKFQHPQRLAGAMHDLSPVLYSSVSLTKKLYKKNFLTDMYVYFIGKCLMYASQLIMSMYVPCVIVYL